MVMGRERSAWDHTAVLWSLIANTHRDEKRKPTPYHPADVHPYRAKADYARQASQAETRLVLKKIYEASKNGS